MDTAITAPSDGEAAAPRLTLHIPPHHPAPGERPDFSYVRRYAAGVTERPSVDVPAQETHEFAYHLIRVLDDDGAAVGAWDPKLDPETLRRGLRAMMLTRAYDERMYRAQRQGKTSFYMKCTGEEAIGVAQAFALAPDDMAFPTYRQQGILIARGWPLLDMMCQCYSNAQDRLKGRQLPVLYSAREASFFSLAGNLGNQFPQAVGWAMASAYKRDRRIAVSWIGEGSTAEPDFHHALTFASVYRAPVVLNIVNNQWAISSHQGDRLWPRVPARRRQRFPRGPCRDRVGGRAGAGQPWRDADRALHLPRRPAFDERRPQPLPPGGGGERVAARRSDRAAVAPPDPNRRMVGGAPRPARKRAGRRSARGGARSRAPRHARPGPAFQRQDDVRGCLQGDALAPPPAAPGARGVRWRGLCLSPPPNRIPGESRGPPGNATGASGWIPAFAGNGMTDGNGG